MENREWGEGRGSEGEIERGGGVLYLVLGNLEHAV